MSRVNKIKAEAPDLLERPEVLDAATHADELHALKTLYDTDGGKMLVDLLLKDVVYAVRNLSACYKTATHTELIAIIAKLSSDLDTAKLLLNAKEGLEILDKELQEALND
jgi:hypothetical protein